MTLSATYEPRRQQGNGVTKEFSYSFDPYSLEALRVYIEENGVQTETQDYTATADENGGIVTFNVAPTSEQYVVIARSVPQDQEVPFYTSSGFDAGVVENSLDKLTAMVQEVNNEAVRSAKLPKGYNINLELPVPESGKGLYWNNEGTGFQNSRLNLDDVETLTKSYRDQSLAARDEAVASSTRAVNTVKEATDLLANTQTYVEEAVVTIDTAVADAKAAITETSEEAKETINSYVSNAEESVKQIAQEEANKAINDAAAQAVAIAVEYAENEIKPELVAFRDSADEDATAAAESARVARAWATGEDAEVQEIEADEHSSRGYADLAMAIANTPEDVPVDTSTLLALEIIKGPKGDAGSGEFSGDIQFEGSFNVHGDDNHPVKVTSLAGASASGYQVVDSNGAGESDFEHYASGDRYGTRIANKSTATGKSVNIDLYQTTAGKSVLDLSKPDTILAPQLLDIIFPIGSYYLSEEDSCPLADWMDGCQWEKVGTSLVSGDEAAVVGNGITLGLTDGTAFSGLREADGAYRSCNEYGVAVGTSTGTGDPITNNKAIGITTDPTKSGIVANLPTITVNIFRRTM